MMLCRCMRIECKNTHWADLSPAEQAALEASWKQPVDRTSIHEEERPEEDKSWPPNSMETK